ncbi:MAG: alkaline phosphatase D family protein [Candidatus Rokubacteria bacterium]|nr:alkaline phosphatase D family protein [Candidatus Rokubacteria bacterium]
MAARRGFVALALVALCAAVAAADDALLVTVGDVTATSAVVWVRGASGGAARIALAPSGSELVAAGDVPLAADRDSTGKRVLTGLAPATRYAYRLTLGAASLTGEFVTAPASDALRPVTFTWSGDLGGGDFCRRVDGGYPIFRAIAKRRPDFFLFVGDTVYADRACHGEGLVPGSGFVATTVPQYHAKHRYNRADAAVQEAFRQTSVYAIWDDHEVRNDFAGSTEPLMPFGRQAFLDYFPIVPPPDEPGRLYRRFRWGRALEVFILDTRQYRSPNTMRDGPDKTMLGATQREWLLDAVAGSDATWKVVVSSVSLSIPTGRPERRDSWTDVSAFGVGGTGTGFARERDLILSTLRRRGVRNLVVVVADVHHAEILRHQPFMGFVLHELVAGPLSATLGRPRPVDVALLPTTLWSFGGGNNFGEVVAEPERLTVRIVGEEGAVLHTHVIQAE